MTLRKMWDGILLFSVLKNYLLSYFNQASPEATCIAWDISLTNHPSQQQTLPILRRGRYRRIEMGRNDAFNILAPVILTFENCPM